MGRTTQRARRPATDGPVASAVPADGDRSAPLGVEAVLIEGGGAAGGAANSGDAGEGAGTPSRSVRVAQGPPPPVRLIEAPTGVGKTTAAAEFVAAIGSAIWLRSEEHTSELQSPM